MANTYLKKCLASSAMREMQIKTAQTSDSQASQCCDPKANCFFFSLYFKSDRFVGQAELGLRANLKEEKPGGEAKKEPSFFL